KESLTIDPITWELFLHKIECFSQNWPQGSITVSRSTDDRTNLSHSPRVLSKQPANVLLNSSSTINFYDAFAPTPAPMSSIPARPAELIHKVNHSCFLGIFGILSTENI